MNILSAYMVRVSSGSFTPSFAGWSKSSSSSTQNVFRHLKARDLANFSHSSPHPLMSLRLSSPSSLDFVIHDGSSENPLYVIDTDDNVTKVRRSDPRGFINIMCTHSRSRASKEVSETHHMYLLTVMCNKKINELTCSVCDKHCL